MVEKNQEYIVEIEDNGYKGEGIAKIDNFTIFIQNAIKGEKVRILIVKVLANYAFGKLLEVIKHSPHRVNADCSTYPKCGGCTYRHIDYEKTLEMKKEMVVNCLKKENVIAEVIKDTVGMGVPYYYRNKLQYPLGVNRNGEAVVGIYSERSHEIIPTPKCKIQNELAQQIVDDIYKFVLENNIEVYNEKTLQGILRHIVIKIGFYTNEVMIILVVNNPIFPKQDKLIEYLKNKYSEIKTIVKNINTENTNVIFGKKNQILYGTGYIQDRLGDYMFKISPLSFYQTNPVQTELLYNIVLEKAKLTGKEIVFDLFCGIGTIGIFLSKQAKKVYGIEIIEDAIKDAKENAKINNISNTEFHVGEVQKILPTLKDIPNVVIVDPPRRGCETSTIETLLQMKPEKIIYVSCNPATLVRDLKKLSENYTVEEIQPIDMFPFTSHVECVVAMTLRETL